MFDLILGMIIVLMVSIFLLVMFYLNNAICTGFNNTGLPYLTCTGSNPQTYVGTSLGIFADTVLLIFVSIAIGAIIGGYFTNKHPIFAIGDIFMLFVILLLSQIFANVFQNLVALNTFMSIANQNLPSVVLLFQSFGIICLVIGVGLIVVQYGKPSKI